MDFFPYIKLYKWKKIRKIYWKIFLLICSFIAIVGIAFQFVKIINENKYDNNNVREEQQQMLEAGSFPENNN